MSHYSCNKMPLTFILVLLLSFILQISSVNSQVCDAQCQKEQYEDLSFDPDGPGQVSVAFTNPHEIFAVKRINDEAFEQAEKLYPGTGGHNNDKDAFRHTYFNFRLAQEIGAANAKRWADAHERSSPNPVGERIMDLKNNRLGRDLAGKNSGESKKGAVKVIMGAMKNGQTINTPKDCCNNGGARNDPHLSGFDGSHFNFYGEDRKKYILFGTKAGDILVSAMHLSPSNRTHHGFRATYFAGFGLQVSGSKQLISLSFQKDRVNQKWRPLTAVDGNLVSDYVSFGSSSIRISNSNMRVTVMTAETIFIFQARQLESGEKRHWDVSVDLRGQPSSDARYLGILGFTLNRHIGALIESDLNAPKSPYHLELSLRRNFKVESLFPRMMESSQKWTGVFRSRFTNRISSMGRRYPLLASARS